MLLLMTGCGYGFGRASRETIVRFQRCGRKPPENCSFAGYAERQIDCNLQGSIAVLAVMAGPLSGVFVRHLARFP